MNFAVGVSNGFDVGRLVQRVDLLFAYYEMSTLVPSICG